MDDSSTVTFHSMSSHGLAIIRVYPLPLSASDSSFVIVLVDLPAHLLGGSPVSLSLGWWSWWLPQRRKRWFGDLKRDGWYSKSPLEWQKHEICLDLEQVAWMMSSVCLSWISYAQVLSGLWLGIDLIILRQNFCPHGFKVQNRSTPLAQKTRLLIWTDTQYSPTHPSSRINHGLFTYAAVSEKNEWGTSGWRGNDRKIWERCRHLASATQTQGCVEESEEDVVSGGDTGKVKSISTLSMVSALCLFKMCFVATRPGLRRVLSTSSSRLPQTMALSPSAE